MEDEKDNVERFIEWSTQYWWPVAIIIAVVTMLYHFL